MTSSSPFRLALVSMPWAIFNRPSVQLGVLKSYIEENSRIKVDAYHPYLGVARLLGKDLYHAIAENFWISEALYSAVLFPNRREQAAQIVQEEQRRGKYRIPFNFDRICDQLKNHLFDWADKIKWKHFDLIGFSVCFNQLLPTLSTVDYLKKNYPELPVVLGGSSCHEDFASGLLNNFQVDYMVSGEGEEPLLSLCNFLSGQDTSLAPSVVSKSSTNGLNVNQSGQRQIAISSLPCPNYDDYFQEVGNLFGAEPFIPVLPVEFSRGCWWNKCTFCNLNLQWHGYRFKTAEKMVKEVRFLAERYKTLDFVFTDNSLPPKEALSFFERIYKTEHDFHFFAEIRADYRGTALEEARKGGLTEVQVGIEGFSNSLLEKMSKGVTVMDNLTVMRDAMANGITLDGNLIVEFPGSSKEEVDETLKNIDFAFPFHPLSTASFFLGYGSPVDNDPIKYGILARFPHRHAKKLFPDKISSSLRLLVKDFRGDRISQRSLWGPVVEKVKKWQTYHKERSGGVKMLLSYRDGGDFIIIRQELRDGKTLHHRLKGLSRRIYLACGEKINLVKLTQLFPTISRVQIEKFLDDLVTKKLVYREADNFLSLAIRDRS